MNRNWIWWRSVQVMIDFLGLWGCFLLAYFLRVGWIFSTDFPFDLYLILSFFATFGWIMFLLLTKFYRVVPVSTRTQLGFEFGKILFGGAIAIGLLIISYFFPREILFSRLIGLYIFAFGSTFLLLSHLIYRTYIRRQKRAQSSGVYRTLIIGANRVADKIIHHLTTDPFAPYHVIGVIDPYGLAPKNFRGKVLGKLSRLEEVCAQEKIDAIVQCDGFEHTLNIISFCQQHDIKFQFEPALRGIFEENLRIRRVANMNFISFVERDYVGTQKMKFWIVDWLLKNVFDID